MSDCLDANVAAGLVDRSLPEAARADAEIHIADCDSCRRLIAELARSLEPSDEDEEVREIGRYQIRGIRGRGAMGTIYEALDPKLDRLVAIKVMQAGGGTDGSSSHARMLREARALAKLAHPNVVPVFDVGELGDDVYIAMELIEGQTLREWLTTPRTADEILEAFCDAGRGLAAAHDQGMVHRDFKPANVIVGEDGRVRVVDFGLVSATGSLEPSASSGSGANSALDSTRTGTVLGTPAYMAPEQHAGEVVDHRADQFGFAVSLFEALFEQRPFPGNDVAELAKATVRGDLAPPPSGSGVSKRCQDALARALSSDPSDRFPRIDDLIAELLPIKRRWIPLAVAMVATLALAATVSVVFLRGNDDVCQLQDGGSIWSADHAARLQESLASSAHPSADDASELISRRLATYNEDWAAEHRRGCRAAHVEKSQPVALFERQLICLFDRRERARVIGERLRGELSVSAVDELVLAANRLPAIADCASSTVGLGAPLPPAELREPVREVRAEISRAFTELDLAGDERASTRGKSILARARGVGFTPLVAEALYLLGRIQIEQADPLAAEASLREAVTLAARDNLDVQLASLWIEITMALFEQGRYADAVALAPVAEAAILRANVDSRLRARGLHAMGEAYWWQPNYERALAMMREAATLIETTYGDADGDLPYALAMLAEALIDAEEAEDALPIAERGVALAEKTYGRFHSVTAWSRGVLGMALVASGRNAEAKKILLEAKEAMTTVTGGHPEIAWIDRTLGNAHFKLKEFKQAIPYYKEAEDNTIKNRGANDFRVSLHLANRAMAELALGNVEVARRLLTRASEIRVRSRGAEHLTTAYGYRELATLEFGAKNYDVAAKWVAKAETIYRNTGESEELAVMLAAYAVALDGVPGAKAEAIEVARRALAVVEKSGDEESAVKVREWLAERGANPP